MGTEENNKKNLESNPIGQNLNVNVSIPKQIKIDLVDASTLSDLEIWIFIASVMSNFVVGFAVAWAQTPETSNLLSVYKMVTLIFAALLLFSFLMVYVKYKKLSKEKNSFNLEVTSAK